MNTTVKDLIIPLEQFPHVQSEAPVHEAVGLLFSHVNGTGRLQYDELLVISADNQYVGRLTVRGILTCYFPTLFATGDKQIFAGKKEKFSDLAILMEDSFQGECKRQGALPVRDYMAPPLKSIKANLHPPARGRDHDGRERDLSAGGRGRRSHRPGPADRPLPHPGLQLFTLSATGAPRPFPKTST